MSRYIGNYVGVPSTEPAQGSASGVWSLVEQLAYQRNNQWPPARDPYYNQTVLHLSGNIPNTSGPQAMNVPLAYNSDASSNNHLITPNGDVSPRPFSPYMGNNYSVYFIPTASAATVGSSFSIASPTPSLSFGTGDFTVECWLYKTKAQNAAIIDTRSGISATPWAIYISDSNYPYFYDGNSYTATVPITLNQWTHIAVTRASGTLRIFIGGIQGYSSTVTSNFDRTAGAILGGKVVDRDNAFDGYLSNLRVVKGQALYTTLFTPSTSPLTTTSQGAISSNVSLLTFQNNRFIDTSSNNFTLTPSNNPRITDNSPFVTTDWTTGSAYHDSSGDSLTIPTNTVFNFTGDFSIEAWMFPMTTGVTVGIATKYVGGSLSTSEWYFVIDGANSRLGIALDNNSGEDYFTSATNSIIYNAWNHCLVTRVGNAVRLFVNGVLQGYNTTSRVLNTTSTIVTIGGNNNYQSDLRIVKGGIPLVYSTSATTIGTSVFTPPSRPTSINDTLTSGAVSLLTLQTRAASQNHGVIDTSPNEFIVTRNGNVSQGIFSPFSPGGWSVLLNGSSGLTLSNNANYGVSANTDFCWEAFIYMTSLPASNGHYAIWNNRNAPVSACGWQFGFANNSGTYAIVGTLTSGSTDTGVNINLINQASATANQWHHIALVRSNGIVYAYWDGVSQGSISYTSSINAGAGVSGIGWRPNGYNDLYFSGYISNFRFVNGSAVYPGGTTFSVPVVALTAVPNTVLLTAGSNRFRDLGTQNAVVSVQSSPQVQAFSPFRPSSTTQPLVTGGSAYFDGNDYLDIPIANSSVFDIVGAFSLECWFYYTSSSPGNSAIIGKGGGASGWGTTNGNQWALLTDSGSLYWMVNNGSGGNWSISTTTPASFAWHHLAISYNGTTTRVWLNGSSIGTNTSSYGAPTTRNMLRVGVLALTTPGYYHTGYISGLRFVQGQDLYNINNTNIVIPTAPPAATQNTSLLLNFTGGGIVDATGRHVLETVGNSHKSTSQVKFAGTASEYFDGTSDYLTIRDNPLLELGSGDFTIEAWVYPLNNSSRSIFGHGPDGQNWWAFYLDGTGKLEFAIVSGNSTVVDRISSTTVNTNTWTHVAVTRSGSTFRLFIDGQEPASYTGSPATTSAAAPDFSSDFWIGGQRWSGSGNSFQGYIQDLRITRGIARYTSNFTINTTIPVPFRIG